jgi:hypothetical protein
MEMDNIYSADDAKKDSLRKEIDINNFIDEDKILLILSGIKASILSIKPQSNNRQYVSKEYSYDGHMSEGEIKFFQNLGYKVEYIDSQREGLSYFNIIWK